MSPIYPRNGYFRIVRRFSRDACGKNPGYLLDKTRDALKVELEQQSQSDVTEFENIPRLD